MVFDLETVHSAAEVGGWSNVQLMRLSAAVIYDFERGEFLAFREYETDDLVQVLSRAECVIGYNLFGLCYRVLSYYSRFRFDRLHSLDLLDYFRQKTGSRERLEDLARATLNRARETHGLDVLNWAKSGAWEKVAGHCRQDVELIKEIYEFGLHNKFVMTYLPGGLVPQKLTVDWV